MGEWGADSLRARRDLLWLRTEQGQISAVHIRGPDLGRAHPGEQTLPTPARSRYTVLYSHGNAEDLGLTLPYLDHMAEVCNCDVFAYDYLGYGISEGQPSEENCYLAINAAYAHLRGVVSPDRI